jgi:hypothetical protein
VALSGPGVNRAAIEDVFTWVDSDAELSIEAVAEPLVPAAPPDRVAAPVALSPEPAATPVTTPAAKASEPIGSIRVGVDKIDLLMNMVGELVITQSMLGELDHDTKLDARRIEQLREGLGLLARNTRALQESVMRLRSVPISVVFNRFPRLVHDLGQQLGKQVALKVSGQSTEIDKTVVEKLGDPLIHLVRNSLDHGLESAEERRAAQLKVKTAFEGLKGRIDGLKHIEVGVDISRVDYACDVVLVSEFANAADLRSYATHPEHLRVRQELGDLRIERHQVDYAIEPEAGHA